MKSYYDWRAPEYDQWYHGTGRFAARERPGWEQELRALAQVIGGLLPARTLDVACGTGFLTRHLPGAVMGLDQSPRMLLEAARQAPQAALVRGDALALPFGSGSLERLFSGHFYGHLEPVERAAFLAEARRVARELVLVDASRMRAAADEEWQERVLNDGTCWKVYKRFFTPGGLLAELGGGEVIHAGLWFVAVRSPLNPPSAPAWPPGAPAS